MAIMTVTGIRTTAVLSRGPRWLSMLVIPILLVLTVPPLKAAQAPAHHPSGERLQGPRFQSEKAPGSTEASPDRDRLTSSAQSDPDQQAGFVGVREEAEQILEEGEYQTRSPDGQDGTGRKKNTTDRDAGGTESQRSEGDEGLDPGSMFALGSLLRVFVWGVVAAVVVFLLYAIISSLRRNRGATAGEDTEEEEEDDRPAVDRSGMEQVMQEADELAQEGRYTEAIRAMFLDATRRIEEVRPFRLEKSSTNREYLAQLEDGDPFRKLCAVLVQAVDRFYYGGQSCEQSDYDRCRDVWKNVQERTRSEGAR